MPRKPELWYAGAPYWYAPDNTNVDIGQVLQSHERGENTALMLEYGHIIVIRDNHPTLSHCGVCGAEFISVRWLDAHGRKRHPERRDDGLRVRMMPGSSAAIETGQFGGAQEVIHDESALIAHHINVQEIAEKNRSR